MPQEPYLIWRQLTREEAQWIDHMSPSQNVREQGPVRHLRGGAARGH